MDFFSSYCYANGLGTESRGRDTLPLARRGYQVTAVDLAPALLEHCRQQLVAAGLTAQVHLLAADARSPALAAGPRFAAVLLMRPLYHLVDAADRHQALAAAVALLQPGGLLADLLRHNPPWIEDELHVRSFLEEGRRPDHYPRGGFRAYAARPAEIAPLHERLGLQMLALAAVGK